MRIELEAGGLARTRFSVSPLAETISGLQQLGLRGETARTAWWTRWAVARMRQTSLTLGATWPLLMTAGRGWPQFLLPAPVRAETTIDEDLARLRQTTDQQVRRSLERVFSDDLPPAALALRESPHEQLEIVADELRQAHDLLVAPHWDAIRSALRADVAHRAQQLTAEGTAALFDGLHSSVSWSDGLLEIDGDPRPAPVAPRRDGLVLIPVVLGPDRVIVKGHTTTRTTIRYPCRGVGSLTGTTSRPAPAHLERLIGRTKAGLLDRVRHGATTTVLARELGVTPSAVAHHLTVLRANGLVHGRRHGKSVEYTTTALGEDLLRTPFPEDRHRRAPLPHDGGEP